jgi:hypothetical protein
MLSLPSAQVKALFEMPGLTRSYTVIHTISSDCIAHEAWTGRTWMVVLRDGEWSVWCPAAHGAADPL